MPLLPVTLELSEKEIETLSKMAEKDGCTLDQGCSAIVKLILHINKKQIKRGLNK